MKAFIGADGFTFGCDPEVFLVDANGEFVSAHGIIPGTKQEPHKVDCGAIQVDGMAAEINIDPVDTFEDWNDNIIAVMKQLKSQLPKGWGLRIDPAVCFSQQVMDAQPETAKELGCDPDYNAWSGEMNPTPDVSLNALLRTGAGHIHIGWRKDAIITDELHVMNCRDLIKQLDWFIGAWSVKHDPDTMRRQLYGRAGAYRPKTYGVEYRVPSNWWIAAKASRLLIWNRLQAAVIEMQYHEYPKEYSNKNVLIEQTINTGKRDEKFEKNFYYPLINLR